MLGLIGQSRRTFGTTTELERRLASLERQLQQQGRRAYNGAEGAVDRTAETIASVLNSMADRFRGSSVNDEAAKIGNHVAKLGNDALRRLSTEVEHRPLVTLAIAVGVGVLVGLISNRR